MTIALAAGGGAPGAAAGERSRSMLEGYMNHAALAEAVQSLGADHPAACAISAIGASRQGRGLLLLTLAADPSHAGQRPAILITAGLDGTHLVGTETAVRVARRLLEEHAGLLGDVTFYIAPRVNPDAAEATLGPVNRGQVTTLRQVDEDRDGVADEDGPADLDGDGVITLMRRLDPPLDDPPTHLPDPAEPRLMKTPDAAKGERARYSLYVEGLDADDDGRIAEDGPGGVDLNHNFMHRWPEFSHDAGPYQLCELESEALARFVLEHRNIVAAVTYGRHDNLINVPEGRLHEPGGAPHDLDAGDVTLYQEFSRLYKEATGQSRASRVDAAGSFHAWLYAHRGIPSLASVVWPRPDASPVRGADELAGPAPPEATPAKASAPAATPDAAPAPDPAPAPDAGPRRGRGSGGGRFGRRPQRESPAATRPVIATTDEDAAAWLTYSDRDREGAGFVPWQPFDHPLLGPVEIGGFVPGFKLNPPSAQLEELAEKQTAFVTQLAKRVPRIEVIGPTVAELTPGLYEIRFGLINTGQLPTSTAMARRARTVAPTVIRISTPPDQIVAGDRVVRSWGIDPQGADAGRLSQRWIIRAEPGSKITIDVLNAQLGSRTIEFTAMASMGAVPGGPAADDAAAEPAPSLPSGESPESVTQ